MHLLHFPLFFLSSEFVVFFFRFFFSFLRSLYNFLFFFLQDHSFFFSFHSRCFFNIHLFHRSHLLIIHYAFLVAFSKKNKKQLLIKVPTFSCRYYSSFLSIFLYLSLSLTLSSFKNFTFFFSVTAACFFDSLTEIIYYCTFNKFLNQECQITKSLYHPSNDINIPPTHTQSVSKISFLSSKFKTNFVCLEQI